MKISENKRIIDATVKVFNYPKLTETLFDKIKTWAIETKTTLRHTYGYAKANDNYPLWDRGYSLIRNGDFSPEAYSELKNILDIPYSEYISYNFFEDLEAADENELFTEEYMED